MKQTAKLTLGLVLKPTASQEFALLLPQLLKWCARRHIHCLFRESEKDKIQKLFLKFPQDLQFVKENHFYNDVDYIVSLGGDGTLIGVCRKTTSKAPILGINLGRLGFITAFSKTELYEALESLIDQKLKIQKIKMAYVQVERGKKIVFQQTFFNDAVVSKNEIARMIHLRVESNHEHIHNLSADGLIISTTMGSTAYSLAAGGPLVHPELEAFILTPICAHSLTYRPLVISSKNIITLTLLPPYHSVSLTLDGQEMFSLAEHDVVKINFKTPKTIRLIHNPHRSFYETLKDKFVYGRRN